ncbi:MAG: hypothetical protein WAN62_16890, partial [Candidatus Acidiferrum sp.]
VCEWFPGMALEEARRRFRTTLEIDGAASPNGSASRDKMPLPTDGLSRPEKLPAFWEDQLFAEEETRVIRFKIGDISFEGSNPCARCPVPARDSRTGTTDDGFQKRFAELRRAQFPSWSPAARFDHFYRLATNTRVPSTECGKVLHVGDVLSY